MGSRIRTVVMWLLLAALPVQSWAVATMVNCGPSHHRMAVQAVEMADHEHHAVGGHASRGHDHASHQDDAAGAHGPGHAHADEDGDDPQPLSMGKFKCSACATCCLGMALPSSYLTFDASVACDTVEPGMHQGRVVFLTAGLERPPRAILA